MRHTVFLPTSRTGVLFPINGEVAIGLIIEIEWTTGSLTHLSPGAGYRPLGRVPEGLERTFPDPVLIVAGRCLSLNH